MPVIYHIADVADWERARLAGEYLVSTRGLTLRDVGFIHCSHAGQVATVANRFYEGETDLVVLVIDTGRVRAEIREEVAPDSDARFPHIYGPLSADAVVGVEPLRAGPDGTFTFAPEP
jgi:glutathione S-transferase